MCFHPFICGTVLPEIHVIQLIMKSDKCAVEHNQYKECKKSLVISKHNQPPTTHTLGGELPGNLQAAVENYGSLFAWLDHLFKIQKYYFVFQAWV